MNRNIYKKKLNCQAVFKRKKAKGKRKKENGFEAKHWS
jgi:hypothetical protein